MPVRIVCPSCSAALSVRDDLAGRTFRCPKCGGVIPASQSLEEPDEPARAAKTGSKVTGQPVQRAKKVEEDEEGEQPKKSRKKRDEDEEDDRGKKKKGGGGGMILAIIGGILLVCCGGTGLTGYFVYNFLAKKAEEVRKDFTDKVDKQNPPANTGPALEVKAETLAKEYKDKPAAADSNYKGKTVLVEGKLQDITFTFIGEVYAILEGIPDESGKGLGTSIRCVMAKKDVNKLLDTSRGQTLKLQGKCDGLNNKFVNLLDTTLVAAGRDLAPKVTATKVIDEYGLDPMSTNEKYRDRPITITEAVVDSKQGETTLFVRGVNQTGAAKIKVTLLPDIGLPVARLRPGDTVKVIKGEYLTSSGDIISIDRGWILP